MEAITVRRSHPETGRVWTFHLEILSRKNTEDGAAIVWQGESVSDGLQVHLRQRETLLKDRDAGLPLEALAEVLVDGELG
ncbi:hypothetical protein LZ017_17195 [Pelomonas sp. CA6]|uniref:hypothetical protein n=1 Tax=Pelomonas sp. CA6 TaxID=2907999 RepID=UPI001F4C3D28|nr:hypothetical protein [Pelomonas sp. CA6]MCH7345120.1 hypothetical protein [Pelomonas sp. CA6]